MLVMVVSGEPSDGEAEREASTSEDDIALGGAGRHPAYPIVDGVGNQCARHDASHCPYQPADYAALQPVRPSGLLSLVPAQWQVRGGWLWGRWVEAVVDRDGRSPPCEIGLHRHRRGGDAVEHEEKREKAGHSGASHLSCHSFGKDSMNLPTRLMIPPSHFHPCAAG